MLTVKLMSDENMPDDSPWKHYRLVQVESSAVMKFCENEDWEKSMPPLPRFALKVTQKDGEESTYALFGNAYVLSESGKTIASHGC